MKKSKLLTLISVLFVTLLVGSLVGAPEAYAKGPKPPKPPTPKPVLYKAKLAAVEPAEAVKGMGMYKTDKKGNIDFKVSVEGFAEGDVLPVILNGVEVGTIKIGATGEGQLRLRTVKGQNPPVVAVGQVLEVQQEGVAVLAGIFTGK